MKYLKLYESWQDDVEYPISDEDLEDNLLHLSENGYDVYTSKHFIKIGKDGKISTFYGRKDIDYNSYSAVHVNIRKEYPIWTLDSFDDISKKISFDIDLIKRTVNTIKKRFPDILIIDDRLSFSSPKLSFDFKIISKNKMLKDIISPKKVYIKPINDILSDMGIINFEVTTFGSKSRYRVTLKPEYYDKYKNELLNILTKVLLKHKVDIKVVPFSTESNGYIITER